MEEIICVVHKKLLLVSPKFSAAAPDRQGPRRFVRTSPRQSKAEGIIAGKSRLAIISPQVPQGCSVSCSLVRAFGKVRIRFESRVSSEGKMLQIPKYALDILVCPVCKTRVELLADESGLKCVSCRRVYPIRDEIPVMLPEEATIAEEPRDH